MIGVDTNVLVRFLAQDDARQSPVADALVNSLTEDEPAWIGIAAILELVWVLGSRNRFDRGMIQRTLDSLLIQSRVVVEQSEAVRDALRLYRLGNAEFADCMIAATARAAGCSRTVTFDRTAARDAGMELLGSE